MQSGKDYSNEYHYLFRFADDKIAECWFFQDTAYAFSRMSE
jgi:ketosteroid isomerase-like protein